MHSINNMCYVCGYKFSNYFPWGENGKSPMYGDFCPSCGCEFGYEDATEQAVITCRAQWEKQGMEWWDKDQNIAKKPAGWDPREQLKGVQS